MLETLASVGLPRTGGLVAMAAWLSIAVYNNVRDKGTNLYLLGAMFRMDLIKTDPNVGNDLEDRAIDDPDAPERAIRAVIAAQVGIGALLWAAAVLSAASWLVGFDPLVMRAVGNVAIAAFFGLWTFFLCGGLWFGYWIKTSHVQQVHFTLFIISLLLWLLLHAPNNLAI